jgi:hypothetical protein
MKVTEIYTELRTIGNCSPGPGTSWLALAQCAALALGLDHTFE